MSERLRQLELRQRALVLRSDLQRRALADEGAALGARIGGVEGKVALARKLVSWPVLGTGAMLVLAVVGPRRALRLASRALVFASVARRAYGLIGTFAARVRPDPRGASIRRPPD